MPLTRRQALASAITATVAGIAGTTATAQASTTSSTGTTGSAATVALPSLTQEYKAAVETALDAKTDLWGSELLSRPEGPTYENIKDFLKPLMYALQAATEGPQTPTGVHYLPLGMPSGLSGRGAVALHVADGSQIMTNRWNDRNTQIFVGDGTERFGQNIAAVEGPGLYRGYLPVLEVGYRDARGVRYQQEAFTAYLPGTQQLASYVKITVSGDPATTGTILRCYEYCGANCHLGAVGDSLQMNGSAYLVFSPGATFDGTNLDYPIDLTGGDVTVCLVRVTVAAPIPAVTADAAGHSAALARTADYWDGRLAEGAVVDVPEPLVSDAFKNLVTQNLLATWRYSLGNDYEAFYQPESSDTVEALGHFGYTDVYKSALQDLLPLSKGADRRNWEIGSKLTRAADYYRLTKDASLIEANESTYVGYLEDLIAQNAADPNHLLERQQYSSDIKSGVYGLHQIGVAHMGAQNIAEVWRTLGRTDLADRYSAFAAELFTTYLAAARSSQVTLPDGALFTPVELLSGTQPWDPITGTTLGGYYNLVVFYGFASRVYAPGSDEARRTLQYVYSYGSRLLGMLRARDSADDNVYEVEQVKFLADNDEADQIVLSFYGKLAHGMTRGTFIAGESHNIGPIATKWPDCRGKAGCVPPSPSDGWAADEYYRAMYLPPNTANNSTFLQALRLMLVRTTVDDVGTPSGLNLAYATPRGWLEHGKTIRVAGFPTEFGTLACTITSDIRNHHVSAVVEVPSRDPLGPLSLRLRVPKGYGMVDVHVNGREWKAFDAAKETVDLTGSTGRVTVDVTYRTLPAASQ
jgi:hypothetical protein